MTFGSLVATGENPDKRGGQAAVVAGTKELSDMAAIAAARGLKIGLVVVAIDVAVGELADVDAASEVATLVFLRNSESFLQVEGVGDCGLEGLWRWRSRTVLTQPLSW